MSFFPTRLRPLIAETSKRIAAGESVRQITADKKVGLSERGFYKMMQAGDEVLVQRYAPAREIQADRMPP